MSQMFGRSVGLCVALLLAGCAATVDRRDDSFAPLQLGADARKSILFVVKGSNVVTSSEDWPGFREELLTAMRESGSNAGIPINTAAEVPETLPQPATVVVATVQDYRIVGGGARFMLGAMIGKAFVEMDVSFLEFPGKLTAGDRKYSTGSSGGHGIFGATTSRQLYAISAEIVQAVGQR